MHWHGRCLAEDVYGIDTMTTPRSTFDWTRVRESGRTFAFVRATYGGKTDPGFARTWRAMREAGITRGAWQMLRHDEDPAEQAIEFLKAVELKRGDLAPLLDLERMATSSLAVMTSMVKTWCSIVESELEARHGFALRPILRTSSRSWPARKPSFELEHHALCVIDPLHFDVPALPPCWEPDQWMFHQYTIGTPGLPGADGAVQLLRFNPCARGARGTRVRIVKELLRAAGFGFGVSETGDYDDAAARAVAQFQRSRMLVEDGIVGPKTFAALHWR